MRLGEFDLDELFGFGEGVDGNFRANDGTGAECGWGTRGLLLPRILSFGRCDACRACRCCRQANCRFR